MNHMDKELSGDGRRIIRPNPEYETFGTGMSVRIPVARKIVQWFIKSGYSHHSSRGATMWVIQEFCILNDIPCYGYLWKNGGYLTLNENKHKFEINSKQQSVFLIDERNKLYKALKELVEFIDDEGDWSEFEQIKQAKEVLKKAEGR